MCPFIQVHIASKLYNLNLKQLFKAITSFFKFRAPKGHCFTAFFPFFFPFLFNSIHSTGCGLSTRNFTKPYPKWFEFPPYWHFLPLLVLIWVNKNIYLFCSKRPWGYVARKSKWVVLYILIGSSFGGTHILVSVLCFKALKWSSRTASDTRLRDQNMTAFFLVSLVLQS